jgi:hypothetical protein
MTTDWAPDVLARLRSRFTDSDGIGRWMARCATDREFCRWVATLGLDLTEAEASTVDAVVEAGAVDVCVLVPVEEYEALAALRASVAIDRLDHGPGPHVRPYRSKVPA